MSITPTFSGEVQFRRYSDTSTQGQQVVFSVADREALQPFIGKEGKRFMAVLVEIGDDEQPVEPVEQRSAKEPAKRMGPALDFLVKLSRDAEFLSWLEGTFPDQWTAALGKTPADKGASVVRAVCSVESRNEIDENRNAFALFEVRIRKPWAARKSTKQPAQVAEEGETA